MLFVSVCMCRGEVVFKEGIRTEFKGKENKIPWFSF